MPLIDRVVRSFLDRIFSGKGKKHMVKDDKPTLCFSTPFLGPGSLDLKSPISRLTKQCYPSYKLWVVFSTSKRLSHSSLQGLHSLTPTFLCG